jgi:glycerol kinase
MSYIIAIDLGTTGSRAIAFSRDGTIVASHYSPITQYYPQPGWVEHDPEELYSTALDALKNVAEKCGTSLQRSALSDAETYSNKHFREGKAALKDFEREQCRITGCTKT